MVSTLVFNNHQNITDLFDLFLKVMLHFIEQSEYKLYTQNINIASLDECMLITEITQMTSCKHNADLLISNTKIQ